MALPEGVSGSSGGEGLHGYIKASRSENCKIIANNMIVTIVVLLACLFAGSIESNLREVFSNPDWLTFDEESICDYRQRLEMENTEFNYGHNVNHREKNNE